MLIKDIRHFREFYKSNIKRTSDPDRNPHFAGEEINIDGKTQFGFFEMFNGQGDIENKLTTILNIAGDSQAIYEFMQNAVDAGSNNFFLAKYGPEDRPYLIVLNDGEYFTLQSVISILAIGASSKYRNPDNIGQFGVGFKLAHRLIGADNSLRELLEENKGPILFSWCNGELAQLATIEEIRTTDPDCIGFGKNADSNCAAPWLFKIVATNFPCLTNDPVFDAKGRPAASLFTEEDFQALRGAAIQCLDQMKGAVHFKTGTLLVIPLHPNKVEHVIGNIPKGLEVAATIISRRANRTHDIRTQIESVELEPEHLYAEQWQLNEQETRGKLGNEQVKVVELMFLYGNPFETNPFRGKPQFYRYFPMSLEQHGFRFAIHSNALTLSSARTELQENDSNKFLFSKLMPLLELKLKEYAANNSDRFYQLYVSLLLSNRGEGNIWIQGRQWLEHTLWEPLQLIIKNNIPVKLNEHFIIAEEPNKVLVKNSRLPIEDWYRKEHGGWFFWEEKEQPLICNEAYKKLELKSVNLLDVLSDAQSIEHINKWLIQSPDHASELLTELNEASFENYDKAIVWKHFSLLKLWWFNNGTYSIDVLSKEEKLKYHLINYGPLNEIRDRLIKVDILVSIQFIDSYSKIERSIRETSQRGLPYLFNYEELNKLLSIKFIQSTELNVDDKRAVFISIESAVRASANTASRRIETMKPLALFSNKRGETKPLFQLTSVAGVPQMLQGWRINEGELSKVNLNEYLSDTREAIYENIIKPFWNDIATQQEQGPEQRKSLFGFVKSSYNLKPNMGPLLPQEIFFAESGGRPSPFYHQTLSSLSETDYNLLSQLLTTIDIHFPQRSLLQFYNEAPFLLTPANAIDLSNLKEPISANHAKALIRWLLKAFPDVVKKQIYIATQNDEIIIHERHQGLHHFLSPQQDISNYITSHLSNTLWPLPNTLRSLLGDHILLQGEKLLERLIHEAHHHSAPLEELVLIILEHGNDDLKQKLLDNMQPLDLATMVEKDSLHHNLLKLCFSIRNDHVRKNELGKLTSIIHEGIRIPLAKVQNRGSDTLIIDHLKKGKLTFSINELLGGNANAINQQLTHILQLWMQLGLGTHEQIAFALGIHEQRRTQDVWLQLLDTVNDGQIKNGEQLAFIWAIGKPKELAHLNPKVETIAGSWRPLQNAFYLCPTPFIPNDKVLSNRYCNLSTIVDLENEQLDGGTWTIQTTPILKGGILLMPGIEEINKEGRPAFWKYLYDQWEEAAEIIRIVLNGSSQSWEKLLGLKPDGIIISEAYSLPEERVPVQSLIAYGIPGDKLIAFMMALGAQGEHSAIVSTRKFFKKDGGNIDTSMSPSQTAATLKWLSRNNIIVQRDDVASFYRNLAGKFEGLNHFPANTPGNEGLKIVSISDEVYHLSKDDLQRATTYELKPHDIANAAGTAIISLSILQDWSSYLISKTKPLNIKWKETDYDLVQAEAKEWEFPFYLNWKSRYPHFTIKYLVGGEIPRKILVNGNKVKNFRKDKAAISHHDSRIVYVGGADTEYLLNAIDNLEAFNPDARLNLRECYEAQSVQFEKYMELAKNDSGFAKLLQDHAEAIRLQEERAERAKTVKNGNNKYTINWFLNLLELVRVQEKSTNIPEVTFSKCERIPATQKTYELSESSGKIPANIESFDEIPALITYLNKNGGTSTANTKLIASEKHQKLWVMFPEAAIQPILEEPKNILSIKLEFTRTIDLIDELKNGFRRLGLKDDTNLKATLSPNIDFIFGPPGTGKTTELANRILRRSNEGTKGPLVVLTPTNKAADVLTKKIIELNNHVAPCWLIRAGSCTDPFLLQNNVVKTGSDFLVQASSNTVLITTIHRFSYFMVSISAHTTDKARLCDCPWSEVIFDEASMIPVAYITHAIQARQKANAGTRFLVAGDPLQIPPVFDLLTEDLDDLAEELQQENIYTMVGLKSFDNSIQRTIPIYGSRIHNLKVQHRSVQAIGELFSKFQYGGKIKHSRGTVDNNKPSTSRPLPKHFADLGFKPITIIRYPVKSGDSIFKPQKLDGSPIHLYSSLLVSELVKVFRNEVNDKNEKPWSIGILAPYRSQADVLLKMVEAHTYRGPEVVVTTDTVHGFQGDENNIVFAVFNPSGGGDNISCSRFLKKEFILNVAISRAEDYLVMLIPDNESKGLSGLPLLNQLNQLANQTAPELLSVMHSKDLEEKLMGEKRFFEMKTFSTTHQKVNVYGKPDLPYMIRLNEKSLDVHWEI